MHCLAATGDHFFLLSARVQRRLHIFDGIRSNSSCALLILFCFEKIMGLSSSRYLDSTFLPPDKKLLH